MYLLFVLLVNRGVYVDHQCIYQSRKVRMDVCVEEISSVLKFLSRLFLLPSESVIDGALQVMEVCGNFE